MLRTEESSYTGKGISRKNMHLRRTPYSGAVPRTLLITQGSCSDPQKRVCCATKIPLTQVAVVDVMCRHYSVVARLIQELFNKLECVGPPVKFESKSAVSLQSADDPRIPVTQ